MHSDISSHQARTLSSTSSIRITSRLVTSSSTHPCDVLEGIDLVVVQNDPPRLFLLLLLFLLLFGLVHEDGREALLGRALTLTAAAAAAAARIGHVQNNR